MATLPVRRYEGTSAATAVAEPFILTEFLFDILAVRETIWMEMELGQTQERRRGSMQTGRCWGGLVYRANR